LSARWSIPAQVNGLFRHGGDEEAQEQDVTKSHSVGFALMSEHSSYNAALGLARVVHERGHNPIFFVSDQTIFSQFVRTHGFKAAAIPPGHESHFAKPDKIARFRLWKRLQNRAASIRLEQDFLVDLIRTNSLDLCFVDAVRYDLYPYALALAKAGVPTMLLSYTFASRFGAAYPPVFSAATPPGATGPNARSSAMHALRWTWALGTRGRSHAFGRAEYAQLVAKKWLDQMRNVSFERELRRCGRRSAWSEWKRRPLIPEVVFGHRTLDWPAIASDPGRYYFGTTDLFRQTSDFDWSIVDPNKPVVYCNLSTINGFENIDASGSGRAAAAADPSVARFRMARRYVETVLRCFAQRPEWQLLIACGPFYPTLQDAALTPQHPSVRTAPAACGARPSRPCHHVGRCRNRPGVHQSRSSNGRSPGLDRSVRECSPRGRPQRRGSRRPHGGHPGDADGDGRTRTDRPDNPRVLVRIADAMQCEPGNGRTGCVRCAPCRVETLVPESASFLNDPGSTHRLWRPPVTGRFLGSVGSVVGSAILTNQPSASVRPDGRAPTNPGALQIVWPDGRNLFPWQHGHDEALRGRRIVLHPFARTGGAAERCEVT